MKEFNIAPIANRLKEALQQKIDSKTKPVGALGKLEDIALQVGLIQQRLDPVLTNPVVAVFAGDHGIAAESIVTAYPQEVTAQMVQNMLAGSAAVNVFCDTHNLSAKIIDAGVAADFPSSSKLLNHKIAFGTKNYLEQPAMSAVQCRKAIETGAGLVDQWAEQGTNIIGFGEMGIGNTSSAAIITSLITGAPIADCTGKGTGLDESGITKKIGVLRQAVQPHDIEDNPVAILQTFGGFEIAMMVGAMLQAAEQRIVILVDGFIATAAFMLASECYPDARGYGIFAHRSGERGHSIQLEYLAAEPLLQLEMRLGEGTGAAMAYPVVQSAVNFLNEMASFEDAGVSQGGLS